MTDVPAVPDAAWSGARSGRDGRWRGPRRRRSVPHLLVGVLLVLACATGFLLVTVNSGTRRPVLALARPVTVGHVLTVGDLRQVEVGADDGAVGMVGAADAASVIGRPVATSLPAGSLLSPAAVGPAILPLPGRAVVAVAVKPGQLPPEAAAGMPVAVVPMVAGSSAAGGAPGPVAGAPEGWPGVVTSIEVLSNQQVTQVSLDMGEDAARQVAALPAGQMSIVVLTAGGR